MTRTPFLLSSVFLAVGLFANAAIAIDELSIVDVRRHITLSDDDVVYKDFYLNGGEGDGLKKNLVVTAFRKIQVRDASGSQSYGEIQVPVGQLRIIAIYGKIAVAREYKLLSRDELPMLEQTGLMTGDRIDLKGAFVDSAKPKYKKPNVASSAPSANTDVAKASASAPASAVPAAAAASGAPAAPKGSVEASKGPAPASAIDPAFLEPETKTARTAEANPTTAQ